MQRNEKEIRQYHNELEKIKRYWGWHGGWGQARQQTIEEVRITKSGADAIVHVRGAKRRELARSDQRHTTS